MMSGNGPDGVNFWSLKRMAGRCILKLSKKVHQSRRQGDELGLITSMWAKYTYHLRSLKMKSLTFLEAEKSDESEKIQKSFLRCDTTGPQDELDVGLWPVTASELRSKFKSRQAMQEAGRTWSPLGVTFGVDV